MAETTQLPLTTLYPQRLTEDLARSGLLPSEVRAKPITPAEKAATGSPMGVDGYVIPYFDLQGKPIQFYRVRLFDTTVKYRQIADTPNHIYFPPRLLDVLGSEPYLLLVEGEKKAAAAVKAGFPCVAVSGVDSWKSRTLSVPKEAQIAQKPSGAISIRLPQGANVLEGMDTVATGFHEMVNYITKRGIPLIICYDTDNIGDLAVVKPEVQRAAATLGYELRHRGVKHTNVRQIVLPAIPGEDKTGLDDFLLTPEGPEQLRRLIDRCRAARQAFPRHPNPREYVNKKLQRPQMPRSEQIGTSLAVLADLDSRGQRLRSPDEDAFYYFSTEDKALTKVVFTGKPDFAQSDFGRYLYREYNLSPNDQRVLGWLASQYSGEEPIADVFPEKVLTWRGDIFYYQISNGTMARVTASSIDMVDNGTDGVLFEAHLTDDLETKDFVRAIKVAQAQPLENWWYDVLRQTRVRDSVDDRQRKLLSLLYYVSPLFYRWRGTQLPVEITTGEAGSGKSTLYELRLSILTGKPKLRNAPNDLRDWNASLASTGALHVTDNVQLTSPELRQRLSDELCRLVTEPRPTIEQRKLYTDTGLINIPVSAVFALTAIKQPFTNVDIIQRSVITDLDKGTSQDLRYDMRWGEHQLQGRGGRCAWLAHQLLVVQRILQVASSKWAPRYQAKYRLINVEQLLNMCAIVFQMEGDWIATHLEASRDRRATESDWTLEGIKAFCDYKRRKMGPGAIGPTFKVDDIQQWALGEDDYSGCKLLIDTRQLGRYLQQHKHTVATTANLVPLDDAEGRLKFKIRPAPPEE